MKIYIIYHDDVGKVPDAPGLLGLVVPVAAVYFLRRQLC